MSEQTHDGKRFRILNIIDELTRECLASFVARRIRSQNVILILADLFLEHGRPEHIRSDNGPEFVAKKLIYRFKTLSVIASLHRERINLGKWLLRIVQWEDSRSSTRSSRRKSSSKFGDDITTKFDRIHR